jgi:hypothetical protein
VERRLAHDGDDDAASVDVQSPIICQCGRWTASAQGSSRW